MKILRTLSLIPFFCFLTEANAQNIYANIVENCKASLFCLDCGDEKASAKPEDFKNMIEKINTQKKYSNLSGKVLFQVLVDSLGRGCVLSHTDNSKSAITKVLIKEINNFTAWIPALTNGKKEGRTSISLLADITNGVVDLKIQRVDQKAFLSSFDTSADPEIFNKKYVYKNEHLKNYSIRIWNNANTNLPNNLLTDLSIDKNNTVWLTIDDGLVKFNGTDFLDVHNDFTGQTKYFYCGAIGTANDSTIWIYAKDNVYSYSNRWTMYDEKITGLGRVYNIINNEKTNELFFCGEGGLTIYKQGKWSNLNKNEVKELPSNRVNYAKLDSKGRLWLSTWEGCVLINEKGEVTNFNNTNTVLKGKSITSMDEDENGNVYFSLYEFDRKDKTSVNNNEGVAVYDLNGVFQQYTTDNSGMPFNHVSKVLYDKREKVLWIATDRAGLVRYDLKGGWENYHNKNSDIPTSYIADMAFDNNGVLYLATRQGLVRFAVN